MERGKVWGKEGGRKGTQEVGNYVKFMHMCLPVTLSLSIVSTYLLYDHVQTHPEGGSKVIQ